MKTCYSNNVQQARAGTVCYAGVASATEGTAAVPTGDWLSSRLRTVMNRKRWKTLLKGSTIGWTRSAPARKDINCPFLELRSASPWDGSNIRQMQNSSRQILATSGRTSLGLWMNL